MKRYLSGGSKLASGQTPVLLTDGARVERLHRNQTLHISSKPPQLVWKQTRISFPLFTF